MSSRFMAVFCVLAGMSGLLHAEFGGEITPKRTLADVLAENPKVVVDYHGEAWCGPCRKMAPTFKSVAQKFDDVKFVKCDIDLNKEYVPDDIRGVPTFVFYENKQEIKRFSGVKNEADFTNIVKTVFGPKVDVKEKK